MRDAWGKVGLALTQLPQHEDEAWDVDVRAFAGPPGGDNAAEQCWAVAITSAMERELLLFEPVGVRPHDSEVWNHVVQTMRQPHVGEPRRPAEVHVARKTWFRAWHSKLQQIGVACRLDESLEAIDQTWKEAAQRLDVVERFGSESSFSKHDWSSVEALPQRVGEIWQADVQRLPTWMHIAGEPTQPWVSLVADVTSDTILATDIAPDEPKDGWLLHGVLQAIRCPAVGEPHRPRVIHAADHQMTLAAHLERVGVQCVASTDLRYLRRMVDELADHFTGQHRRRALIHSPGVTRRQLGSFFAAAAELCRSRPWRHVPGDTVIKIACDRLDCGPRYAVVTGQSGMELGLAVYEDLETLRRILSSELSDEETARRTSTSSVTYGEALEIAP